MGVDTVDKRFALLAKNGAAHYPYKKSQKATGRFGFALSAPGMRDAMGSGTYTENIDEVIKKVVFEGWKVRVKEPGKIGRSAGIEKLNFPRYWISDELKDLVAGAKMAPSLMPGLPPAIGNHPLRDSSQHLITKISAQTVASSNAPDEKEKNSIEMLNEDTVDSSLLTDLDEIDAGTSDGNDPTERMDNRMSRIGQGKFRKNTIATWGGEERCAVTAIAIRQVLTASHIIPWSKDVMQRKRGCNGILLTAHLDRLFDQHLIGFKVSPEVNVFSLVVAPRLAARFLDLAPLGLTADTTLNLSKVKRADRPGLEENLRAHLAAVINNN
ncbi:HNH endonuclease [Rhodoferax sp.]|uniref:HNH endonuclease n=1 Tax=Rhodoferax sp. TaxID=50421 RepID=UPI002736731E|nr:HNH endonuclease signature motif containing protein [Rhodoferax sp.]MDP3190645.1 HNH endonuclease signature motif containing protein [Rhodoferax sp.]